MLESSKMDDASKRIGLQAARWLVLHDRGLKMDDASKRIGLQAARWLVLHDRGLTPSQQDEFLQWLAQDHRHGEWLRSHHRTWEGLNLLVQWRPEHADEPNPDLLARPRQHHRRLWLASGLAAAAVLTAAVYWWTPTIAVPNESEMRHVSTTLAHQYENLVLEDGTVVELHGGTILKVDYRPEQRRVELVKGEAHFQVAPNTSRPFVVHAAGVDVRAVGTAFNVKLQATAVEVLVTEGKVSVNAPDAEQVSRHEPPVFVKAGERTVVNFQAKSDPLRVLPATRQEIERLLGWQPKLLDFKSTPLRDAVAAFNLRNRLQLTIADPELGDLPIVASIRSDNLEGFVRLLEKTAHMRVDRQNDHIILHKDN